MAQYRIPFLFPFSVMCWRFVHTCTWAQVHPFNCWAVFHCDNIPPCFVQSFLGDSRLPCFPQCGRVLPCLFPCTHVWARLWSAHPDLELLSHGAWGPIFTRYCPVVPQSGWTIYIYFHMILLKTSLCPPPPNKIKLPMVAFKVPLRETPVYFHTFFPIITFVSSSIKMRISNNCRIIVRSVN